MGVISVCWTKKTYSTPPYVSALASSGQLINGLGRSNSRDTARGSHTSLRRVLYERTMTQTHHHRSPRDNIDDLLLLEDNPGDIRFIEEAFNNAPLNVTVHSVTGTEAALEFLDQRGYYADVPEPDLVFISWDHVEPTGDEVLTTLQTEYSHIPVVMLTGQKTSLETSRSCKPEADQLTEKPTVPEGYIEIVRSVAPGQ